MNKYFKDNPKASLGIIAFILSIFWFLTEFGDFGQIRDVIIKNRINTNQIEIIK